MRLADHLVVCHGVPTLLVEKFSGDEVSVRVANGRVVLTVAGRTHEISRRAAASLRGILDEALTERREYVYTAGTHRADGAYVVSRRGADSAGHSKVFESFEAMAELYESLPSRFTAEDVVAPGVTDGRRHLLVRHFTEHPDFACGLVSRQPLTAEKRDEGESTRDTRR